MTENDDFNGAITKLECKCDKLTRALHDAINKPMGVVPNSAMEFYDQDFYNK